MLPKRKKVKPIPAVELELQLRRQRQQQLGLIPPVSPTPGAIDMPPAVTEEPGLVGDLLGHLVTLGLGLGAVGLAPRLARLGLGFGRWAIRPYQRAIEAILARRPAVTPPVAPPTPIVPTPVPPVEPFRPTFIRRGVAVTPEDVVEVGVRRGRRLVRPRVVRPRLPRAMRMPARGVLPTALQAGLKRWGARALGLLPLIAGELISPAELAAPELPLEYYIEHGLPIPPELE